MSAKQVRRLFEHFHPSNYQLTISPSTESMRFSGTVVITGRKVGRPSERITLHQKGLSIKKATIAKLSKDGPEDVVVSRINNQDSYDEVRLHTESALYPGEYVITADFEAPITRPMHGLYPCYYTNDGEEQILLATQFESHHAREVFPSIDEPEAKATFDLTIQSDPENTVIANTPVLESKQLDDGLQATRFETTPIMSTYLLAFAVGNIHSVEATTKDGILMRTWATAAQPVESLQYANDQAVRIIEYFTDYFQTPFPLKKCDQIALPDFESGAMENWGLITYREIALLTDPSNPSLSSEQYVSMVIAHELSHQWFGNLVTMKWWDDLWLNESFASLMEHIAINDLHPDWHQWEQYTASDVISCSSRDIFKDVQSVHVTVNHPEEISTLFDPAIVYAKGGRLLKMMREYIGDEAFRNALKQYFAQHAYKNTIGDDLWAAMSNASGKDIKQLMDPWLDQSGMPMLSVDQSTDTIGLSQKRFVLDADDDSSIWPIPLLADQPLSQDILNGSKDTVTSDSSQPVIFNTYGSGHMLVQYQDDSTKSYIAKAFSQESIAAEARINILNDLLLLARGGQSPLSDSLDITFKSESESRDAVWMLMARSIGTALSLTEGDESVEHAIKQKRLQLVKTNYDRLGWNDKPGDIPNDIALRHTVLSLALASDHPEALAEARRRYQVAASANKLPAEQRAMIIATLIRHGDDIIKDMIDEYKTTPNPDVQLAICAGLTSVKDVSAAQDLINQALGEKGFVRPQDIFRWYAYLMRNRYTRELTWNWLTTNWDRLEGLFGDSKSFEYFVVYSASTINTTDWQTKFNDFYTPKQSIVALKRNILIAKSEIEARVAWRKREEPRIVAYFNQ